MPAREAPSYSSSRVQRASRLNALEQARLQQRLMLLEKARLHQARLTNQDIRLTSLALDYILACSGHSSEGRGPQGEQRGVENVQQEDPCFLYGERVVSRKARRVAARPQSAVERATFRRSAAQGASSTGSGLEDATSVRDGLPPRPQSSPARRRAWAWSSSEETDGSGAGSDVESERPHSRAGFGSPGVSRPSTAGAGGRAMTPSSGRVTPHQPWEDDTDEVTRRLLKAQQLEQQRQKEIEQRESVRRSQRYRQDLERRRSQRSSPSPSRGYFKYSRTIPSETPNRPLTAGSTSSARRASASAPVSRPTSGVIEDPKPVSPAEKHTQSTGSVSRRAGLSELMSQSRVTMSASAWRAHLASTATIPRSSEVQRQMVMEARKGAERERQHDVMQRVESFMDQLGKK
ncbi:hypothetical protein BaRGS_00031100 [Batillaria attramentaria]|uniref:Uncharacterized protein n=1 Tax=Batillaria attramentaria TaxID=370345 RepID=A0ABD0JRP7_9CAEN|nr:hypothetical protein BaRGS_003532 [Batillaria attramentaria]